MQRGYCRDRAVLAFIAVYLGAATQHVVQGVDASEPAVARSLHRLTDEGLLAGARP